MAPIDWRRTASQILRALRGNRSQKALSRRLGYRSNVACDWEAGRRLPTAAETLRACRRLGVDVDAAFRAFQPAVASALAGPTPYRVDAWLSELAGTLATTELAARTGFSRFAVARWLQGKTQPRLHHFLALVESISGRASDLVQALVPIDLVSELHDVHLRRSAARRLAFDEPWSAAVLRVLETTGYRQQATHASGYIAARLGLQASHEQEILDQLQRAGVARLEAGRYEVGEPLTVDTQTSTEDLRKLRSHWTDVCQQRTAMPRAGDWLAFNVISTSAADLERIREILKRAFREIRALAAASEPPESVALLNLQLVMWNEVESSSRPGPVDR